MADVAQVQNGFAFKSELFTHSDGMPLIRIRDIEDGYTENFYSGEYSEEFVVHRGDILIGMDGDFNAATWQGVDGLLNQRVCRIIPTTVSFSEKFLFLCLQPYLNAINAETSSVTVKHLSSKTIGEIPLPLPPLNEQHRIVAKIEELFSELDKGIESLKTAREQLKVYRQALLKHAFEGKLTAQWREANQGKLETADALLARIQAERAQRYEQQLKEWESGGKQGSKPKAPKPLSPLTVDELAELPELPEGWGWFKLADVSDVSGGLTKNQKRNALPMKRPFLRVANVYANRLQLDEIHDIGVSAQELERVLLRKGDLLIVEGNGSIDQIGRVAVWNGVIDGCVHQNHLIKARPLSIVSPEFVLNFLMSELGRQFIVRAASSTSGLHTLSISKVESLYIPFCAWGEQSLLLDELASKLSEAGQLDQTIVASLAQAEALRQSILKKAFSGQLVPQDTSDEPASELLAHIKAEREDALQTNRRRRAA